MNKPRPFQVWWGERFVGTAHDASVMRDKPVAIVGATPFPLSTRNVGISRYDLAHGHIEEFRRKFRIPIDAEVGVDVMRDAQIFTWAVIRVNDAGMDQIFDIDAFEPVETESDYSSALNRGWSAGGIVSRSTAVITERLVEPPLTMFAAPETIMIGEHPLSHFASHSGTPTPTPLSPRRVTVK